ELYIGFYEAVKLDIYATKRFEELEGDDDIREEFPCPFCSEYLDIVGLCCHIDEEHPIEARNGIDTRSSYG
uniref:Di19 zinc-binding domain-containing protein n=1 Tax=Cucumis melo TaxID=3656 RepID=A0A9I9E7G0_CUCME